MSQIPSPGLFLQSINPCPVTLHYHGKKNIVVIHSRTFNCPLNNKKIIIVQRSSISPRYLHCFLELVILSGDERQDSTIWNCASGAAAQETSRLFAYLENGPWSYTPSESEQMSNIGMFRYSGPAGLILAPETFFFNKWARKSSHVVQDDRLSAVLSWGVCT